MGEAEPIPEPEAPQPPPPTSEASPAVVDADVPPVEETPVATEALPKPGTTKRMERRIDRKKAKADMARQVMRTGIDEMDRNIQDLQVKIDKETDTGKAARLRDQLDEAVAKRETAYAEYEVMISALDTKIAEIKKDLAEIQALKEEIAGLQTFIEANKADLSKSDEVAAKTHTLDEKQKELKKLAPEGREADLNALLKVYEAEQTNIRGEAEHRDEIGEADRILDEVIESEDATSNEPSEEAGKGKDKAKSTSSEGEEEKAARKKELLHNALHKVAYGLAVNLEKNYPGADGNAYEKMQWSGKLFFMKVVMMFGGTPKWAELVEGNPTLSEFLEKKVGLTFTQEDVKKDGVVVPGEKSWVAKWDKPVEGWEPGVVEMADVFETAYGSQDKGGAVMKGITAETTLKELEATAAADTSENGEKTRKLIAAMKEADDTITGETKVQEFLIKNAGKVQENLKPTKETTDAGTPDEEAKEDLSTVDFSNADLLAGIKNNGFNDNSTLGDVVSLKGNGAKERFTGDPPPLVDGLMRTIETPEDIDDHSEGMAQWKGDFALFGINKDPSISTELQAQAKEELNTRRGLTSETGEALKRAFTIFAEGLNELMSKTIKQYAEVMKDQTTSTEEKADYDAILAALKEHNSAVKSTPAPDESMDAERRTVILGACKTHAETGLTGSSDESKISTLQFDSATILPLTDLDFPEIRADAEAAPILSKVKLVVKVPSTNAEEFLTFGLDASDKVIASENHL